MSHAALHPVVAEATLLMEQLEPEPEHVRQVCFLARHLFQQLEHLHQLEVEDLPYLEAASLLHDVGWTRAENGSAHHKHSADIIREHSWKTLNHEETDLVAQIARYHRKSLPKYSHLPFRELRPALRHKLLSLAALIRVADALDRSHRSLVRSIECQFRSGACELIATIDGVAPEEKDAFIKKRDLFELHFSTKLEPLFLESPEAIQPTPRQSLKSV
ncbi:MAG: HD domain-containing protein [Blastochloris sp.]|nr:HD domain-containing protein [Blastochloris sp.]